MLLHPASPQAILAHRDAMIVSLQYGMASRNQELWGLRWSSLDGEFVWVTEVLSNGQLQQWGKTEHSTQRRTGTDASHRCDR
jgi:site-specific recombinase XerC